MSATTTTTILPSRDWQSKSIPLALEGKDVLVKAKTGSGKTAAYAIPVLHKLLSSRPSAGLPTLTARV